MKNTNEKSKQRKIETHTQKSWKKYNWFSFVEVLVCFWRVLQVTMLQYIVCLLSLPQHITIFVHPMQRRSFILIDVFSLSLSSFPLKIKRHL